MIDNLTKREKEVLSLMAKGYSNREISETLIIEICTVKSYTNKIYTKFGLTGNDHSSMRVRAVLYYLKHDRRLQ